MPPVISVNNLGKQYRIGERERYHSLRDSLSRAARSPFKRLKKLWHTSRQANSNSEPAADDPTIDGQKSEIGNSNGPLRSALRSQPSNDYFWALKDISFEVGQGEVVGVIGRNGAGKSTLLKILSRITEPTGGEVRIRGRVGSLLEVGTGFHPELTGRENIFLNGAILGMSREEVRRTFDEIVAFSEIERFIDTPVKRYSSGMYMRLAFAVAAHLKPEILIIDEVLAVGDAMFQRKCLGKLHHVAKSGRTVLFVSHNMSAIAKLTDRAVLLDNGCVQFDGESSVVINKYLSRLNCRNESWFVNRSMLCDNGAVTITDIELLDLKWKPLKYIATGEGFVTRIRYRLAPSVTIPTASFVLRMKTHTGTEMVRMGNTPLSGFVIENLRGSGYVDLILPVVPFSAGEYSLDVGLARVGQGFYLDLHDVVTLRLLGSDAYNSGTEVDQHRGLCVLTHRWIHRPDGESVADSSWIGSQLLRGPEEVYFDHTDSSTTGE